MSNVVRIETGQVEAEDIGGALDAIRHSEWLDNDFKGFYNIVEHTCAGIYDTSCEACNLEKP